MLLLEGDDNLVIELERGYADNFVLDFDWAVTGTAKTGIWERAIPRETKFDNTPINPGSDVLDDFGEYAYITGNQGNDYDDDDVDDGYTTLSSPVFDLTAYESPQISFRWWAINYLAFSDGGQPGNGLLEVKLSNGTDTVVIDRYNSAFNNDLWKATSFLVENYIPPTSTMQIHFTSEDPDPDNVVEGGIDDFLITEQPPTFLDKENELISFSSYPNPVQHQLYITYQMKDAAPLDIRLLNIQGVEVGSYRLKAAMQATHQLPFSYPAGIYFLQIRKDNRLIGAKKLVKY